jgi:shikimate dehydrogenase
VLGAGGAARAAAYGLVKAGAAKVTVVCRTVEKARQVDWGPTVEVHAGPDSERARKECDICALSRSRGSDGAPAGEMLKEGHLRVRHKKALSALAGKGPASGR